jgi:hypothetical protein
MEFSPIGGDRSVDNFQSPCPAWVSGIDQDCGNPQKKTTEKELKDRPREEAAKVILSLANQVERPS